MFRRSKRGGKERLNAKTISLTNMFASLWMRRKTINKALFASQIKIKFIQDGLNVFNPSFDRSVRSVSYTSN